VLRRAGSISEGSTRRGYMGPEDDVGVELDVVVVEAGRVVEGPPMNAFLGSMANALG